MNHKLRAAFALSREEWMLFFQAWVLLLAADVGLRFLPFLTVQRAVTRSYRPQARRVREIQSEIGRLETVVDIAARNHVHNMSCLRRALVLQFLLTRRGVRADLRIGVRREAEVLDAHAWLEYEGRVVSGTTEITDGFTPLLNLQAV